MAARTIRSWADLVPLVEELKEFVVREWVKHGWVRYLAAVEACPLEEAGEARYAPLDPEMLPRRAFREYYYESPGKYRARLSVDTPGSFLEVNQAAEEWTLYTDLSRVGGLVGSVAVFYEFGPGAEPFEGLARYAASVGVPEVARALEDAARLYRASEPYVAAEFAADPGEPPEWFREHVASRVVPVVEEAVDELARGLTIEAMSREVLGDIVPPGWRFRVKDIVDSFLWPEMFSKNYKRSLAAYRGARAKRVVLRVARELRIVR